MNRRRLLRDLSCAWLAHAPRTALRVAPLAAAACEARTLTFVDPPDASPPDPPEEDAGPPPSTPLGADPADADTDVTVAFDRPTGATASPLRYGLNLVRGLDPTVAGTPGQPAYKAGLATMRPGLVRLFGGLLGDSGTTGSGWLVTPGATTVRWDEDKVARALDGGPGAGTAIMLTIPSWPAAFGSGSAPLPSDQWDGFARLCADLVRVLNVRQGRGVRYFEIFNEREATWKDRGADKGALTARIARAMKAVDPTVKVGGAAFVHGYHELIDPYVGGAGDAIDFVSFHGYATGDAATPTAQVFDAAGGFVSAAEHVREVAQRRARRTLEVFHTQYNINWRQDRRMTNATGAVFDALVLNAFAASRLTGAAAWNECDGWYGKMDGSYRLRPGAHVFAAYNAWMTGAVCAASSSRRAVAVLATRAGTTRHGIALVNRDEAEHVALVRLDGEEGFGPGLGGDRITHGGVTTSPLTGGRALALRLPPLSVTVVADGR